MKFPVFQTTLDALRYCWQERQLAVRFGTLPLIIGFILSFAGQAVMGISTLSPEAAPSTMSLLAITLTINALQMVIYAPLGVTWLRLTVLGEAAARNRPIFTFGHAERQFFRWQLLCFLAAVGIIAVGSAITAGLFVFVEDKGDILSTPTRFIIGAIDVAWTCFWLIAVFLAIMRITMILVLAALDQPANVKAAWASTKGLVWRLLGATGLLVLVTVAINLGFQLLGTILAAIFPTGTGNRMVPVNAIVSLFGGSVSSLALWLMAATLYGIVHKMMVAHDLATRTPSEGEPVAL